MSDLRMRTLRLAASLPSDSQARAALVEILTKTAGWDASVLGLTKSDLEDMDEDEKHEKLQELLHQAGDLAEAIAAAFGPELGPKKDDVTKAAKTLQGIARMP